MIAYIQDFYQILDEYNISRKDVCLIGSSVLTNAGCRKNHDLDFAIRPETRDKLIKEYGSSLKILESGTICFNENIQILQNRYQSVGVDDQKLFDKYVEKFDELYIAKVEIEVANKIVRNLPKDAKDLKKFEMKLGEKVDWSLISYFIHSKSLSEKRSSLCRKIIISGKRIAKCFFRKFEKKDIKYESIGGDVIWATSPLTILARCYRHNREDILLAILFYEGKLEGYEDAYSTEFFDAVRDEYGSSLSMKMEDDIVVDLDRNGNVLGNGEALIKAILTNSSQVYVRYHKCLNDESLSGYKRFFDLYKEELMCKITSLMIEQGIFFCGVAWGTVTNQYDSIAKYIDSQEKLIDCYQITEFDSDKLVEEIYALDNLEQWKIRIKQNYFRNRMKDICVFIYDIQDPAFRINNRTGLWLSGRGAAIKNEIREMYKDKVTDYIYDVIFHSGDNYQINKKMVGILEQYRS